MDAPRAAVRLGAAASVAVLVGLVTLSVAEEGEPARFPVLDLDGKPLKAPTSPGYTLAAWRWQPVAIVVADASLLDGVERLRGPGEATPSVELPGQPGLRLFALSAKSTHLGCTVGFNKRLGASADIPDYDGDGLPDGRMMDPCSQSQWDVYHRGAVLPRMYAKSDLAVLDVRIVDGQLVASHFDGPTGPPSD